MQTNKGITANTAGVVERPEAPRYLRLFFLFSNMVIWLLAFAQTINDYPSLFNDFRNRIVGARLMKDGLDPYFFIWNPSQPMKYYDSNLEYGAFLSSSTSTPFWHWLLMPICELPQYQLNLLWFVLQWATVIWSIYVATTFTKNDIRKLVIALVGGLFMFTIGFRQHFVQMQNYLFVPALILTAIYFWRKNKTLVNTMVMGICIAVVVLIRPTLILLFAPLLLHNEWRKPLFAAVAVVGCYVLFVFTSPRQQYNWQRFSVYLKYKGGALPLPPLKKIHSDWKPVESWEGIVFNEPKNAEIHSRLYQNPLEAGNYMYIHDAFFKEMPSRMLFITLQLAALLGGGILTLFLVYNKGQHYWYNLMVAGFTTYWSFEFFSDVAAKLQYYMVLFLYVVLLDFALASRYRIGQLIVMAIGFALCTFDIPVKMNSTIGQIVIMVALLMNVWYFQKKAVTPSSEVLTS
jgi:hypothetical protein